MEMFKLLSDNGIENSLQSSAATASKCWSALAALYRKTGRLCRRKIRYSKNYTFRDISSVSFHCDIGLEVQKQIWRHHFPPHPS